MSRPTVIARCPICGRIPFASVEEYMDGESQARVADLVLEGFVIETVTEPVLLAPCTCRAAWRFAGVDLLPELAQFARDANAAFSRALTENDVDIWVARDLAEAVVSRTGELLAKYDGGAR